jgi:kumamolisin
MTSISNNSEARRARLAAALAAAALLFAPVPGRAAPADVVALPDSIREVPANAPLSGPHRVREVLRADELEQPLTVTVSLKLRNGDELAARVQRGEVIAQAELEARYLPLRSDFDRVSAWLQGQGFRRTIEDSDHMNVIAAGSVRKASAAFRVAFARVATRDGEFSSAVTAPSVPASLAGSISGVVGLQPHRLMHAPHPLINANNVDGEVTPVDIQSGYNVPTTLDGTGQTIAIIMDSAPVMSDLTTFWSDAGISSNAATNYTLVNVGGGPTAPNQTNDYGEVILDTEWSTGIAPGAALRMYAIPDLSYNSLLNACVQIVTDATASVASFSASGPEEGSSPSAFTPYSNEFVVMAAHGITMVSSSGDSGSNPNTSGGNGYASSNALSAMYPASDPNVTGIGGTTPTFSTSWVMTGEVAWSEIGVAPTNPLATGGGLSVFSRPSWQTGTGVPAGTQRCVPDISAMSSANPLAPPGNTGAFIVGPGGVAGGEIGTSLSSPIWAGLTAIINQARAAASRTPIGLLAPNLYPMIGTNALNDVTSGGNGAYSAGTGYDLCTGVGTPNMANLIAVLAPPPAAVGNTPTGGQALASITFGDYDTGDGYQALYSNTTGSNNTGVGTQALFSNVNGNQNVGIGYRTLYANTSGTFNTANGYNALQGNTTGNANTASGYKALLDTTAGSQNTGDGFRTLFSNLTGQDNVALGFNAHQANTTGTQNAAIGSQALYTNSTGQDNAAFGYEALYENVGGSMGPGSYNGAFGDQALYANTTGTSVDALGAQAMTSNTVGISNVALGFEALTMNVGDASNDGSCNVAAGLQAMEAAPQGAANTAAGAGAQLDAAAYYSDGIGYHATLGLVSGYNEVVVGTGAYAGAAQGDYDVILGASAGSAVTNGYALVEIGNPGSASPPPDEINIGTAGVQTQAFVAGIAGETASGGTAVFISPSSGLLGTTVSSERFKTDIHDMGSESSVLFQLRPVTFRYRPELDPRGYAQFGLVAEEVEKAAPSLVVRDADGQPYSVRYDTVNAMLLNEFLKQHGRLRASIEAGREQAKVVTRQEDELAALEARITALRSAQAGLAGRQAEIAALKASLDRLEAPAK